MEKFKAVERSLPEEIANLKQQQGKDMLIYGSGSIVSKFMQFGLIDEYKIFINPVVLGAGKLLFTGLQDKLNLKLIGTKVFDIGTILLDYQIWKSK